LAFGVADGEATGAGLTTGLGLLAGGFSTGAAGADVAAGDGVAAVGVEFVAGSAAQPAARASAERVSVKRAVRVIVFMFGVVIVFVPRFSKIEKRDDNCPRADW